MTFTRRSFLKATGAGFVCSSVPSISTASDSRGPNIIFVLVDDQRNDTLGCAGHPILKTPVIDSLAADGDKENHFPWPKAVDGMYDDMDMPLPRLGDPAIFENHPQFMRQSMNRDRWFWRWDTPEKYQKNMRAYFRMISGVDHTIGRIRKALEAKGVAENAVIIYTSDNGYYMGDRGFAGKWSHYEQSLRIPLIIYDPRLPRSRRDQLISPMALNVDLPATMLEIAGVKPPAHYQGRSLMSLVESGMPATWRDDFFCEHLMNHAAIPKWEGVRAKRYVYARYFEQQPAYEYLHDLEADPDQLTNCVEDPQYAKILAQMRRRCDKLKDQYARAREQTAAIR